MRYRTACVQQLKGRYSLGQHAHLYLRLIRTDDEPYLEPTTAFYLRAKEPVVASDQQNGKA